MSGLQRVYKDAPNSQILKIKRFHKGVWWSSPDKEAALYWLPFTVFVKFHMLTFNKMLFSLFVV